MRWLKRGRFMAAVLAVALIGTLGQSPAAWAKHQQQDQHPSHGQVRPHPSEHHGTHSYKHHKGHGYGHSHGYGHGHAYGHRKHHGHHYRYAYGHSPRSHYYHPVTCLFHAFLHQTH